MMFEKYIKLVTLCTFENNIYLNFEKSWNILYSAAAG